MESKDFSADKVIEIELQARETTKAYYSWNYELAIFFSCKLKHMKCIGCFGHTHFFPVSIKYVTINYKQDSDDDKQRNVPPETI
jgi:hypothetical protein